MLRKREKFFPLPKTRRGFHPVAKELYGISCTGSFEWIILIQYLNIRHCESVRILQSNVK
jgi:hypothetical protein